MSAFADLADRFLDELFALRPELATAMGDHRHDGRWPDVSEAGRQERLRFADRWTAAFHDMELAGLDGDERVDRELALGELEAMRFG